jgi:hypothetical protein
MIGVLPYPLGGYGSRVSSQNDEDGIIAAIISCIDVPRYFVEFGVDIIQGNCIELYRAGWAGLFMDAHKGWWVGCPLPIKRALVTAGNVMDLFEAYRVPGEFGILSIDIDGQDYWVWRAVTSRPVLVVIEYNGKIGIEHSVVMPRRDDFELRRVFIDGDYIGSQFYGASLKALHGLGEEKGYVLVYANGVNGFFVRRDLLGNAGDFRYEDVYRRWPTHHIDDPYAMGFVDTVARS